MVLRVLALILLASCVVADVLTIQETGSTHHMEDMAMRENAPYLDYNYGGAQTAVLDSVAGSNRTFVWKFLNWDTLLTIDPGNTLDSGILYLNISDINGAGTLRARVMRAAWYEGTGTGTATQLHSANGNDRWEGFEGDGEVDSGWVGDCATGLDDAGTADARLSVIASAALPEADGGWSEFRFTSASQVAYLDSLMRGYVVEYGFHIWLNVHYLTTISTSENATTTNRPILELYYTPPEGGTTGRRRRMIMGGE